MASQGDMLLRMLEPAVRPGPSAGPRQTGKAPIESRSFESLLDEAQSTAPATGRTGEADGQEETSGGAEPRQTGPLDGLARVDRIENASLRNIIGGAETKSGQGL